MCGEPPFLWGRQTRALNKVSIAATREKRVFQPTMVISSDIVYGSFVRWLLDLFFLSDVSIFFDKVFANTRDRRCFSYRISIERDRIYRAHKFGHSRDQFRQITSDWRKPNKKPAQFTHGRIRLGVSSQSQKIFCQISCSFTWWLSLFFSFSLQFSRFDFIQWDFYTFFISDTQALTILYMNFFTGFYPATHLKYSPILVVRAPMSQLIADCGDTPNDKKKKQQQNILFRIVY